jgi:TatA/E family protein of Tat protein translocase
MFGLGFGELILIFLIVLIFVGPKKLPDLAKGLGQGLREFQKATKGFQDQLKQDVEQPFENTGDPELPHHPHHADSDASQHATVNEDGVVEVAADSQDKDKNNS